MNFEEGTWCVCMQKKETKEGQGDHLKKKTIVVQYFQNDCIQQNVH